jgi:TRAP-type C4-dicarboxylate transport system permease small subunit
MDKFDKFVSTISSWLNWIAGIALVAMLALIIFDVIGAKLFRSPIPGGIEMVGLLCVAVIAFSLAQTQILRGNIEVEFLTNRLPSMAQRIISMIIFCLGIVLFTLLAWQSLEYGYELQTKGEVSMTRGIALYPFVYIIAICSFWVVLVLVAQCISLFRRKA